MEIELPIEFAVFGTAPSQAASSRTKQAWKSAIREASKPLLPEMPFSYEGPASVTLYYFPVEVMPGDIDKVFRHRTGTLALIDPTDIVIGRKLILPPLPRVNRPRVERLKSANRSLIKDKPWVLGLIEALGAVHVLRRQKMDTRNRIALILLDSNFEIALKEFIVHRNDLFPARTYTDEHIAQLFRNRTNVLNVVVSSIAIPQPLIDRAKHYYAMRNKLIHERASVTVTDHDVDNYQQAVEALLKILFAIRVPAH